MFASKQLITVNTRKTVGNGILLRKVKISHSPGSLYYQSAPMRRGEGGRRGKAFNGDENPIFFTPPPSPRIFLP